MLYMYKGGDTVAIGKDKVRTALTLEKEFKIKLEQLAKEDERSFNSLIIKVLKDYVKEKEKEKE